MGPQVVYYGEPMAQADKNFEKRVYTLKNITFRAFKRACERMVMYAKAIYT